MKRNILLFIMLCFTFVTAFSNSQKSLLAASDKKLLPYYQFRYNLEIKSTDRNGKKSVIKLEGFKKGRNKNILVAKAPSSVEGMVHLRKDNSIWTYYPSIHRSVKTAYQSVFMGTTLNYGDVIALDLSYDYEISDTKENTTNIVLTLKPKKNSGGYAKISLVLDKKTMLPISRHYYSLSGILLKSCKFKEIKSDGGKVTFIREVFEEPLKKQKTIVTISNIKRDSKLKNRFFNPVNLKYLSGE